MNYLIIQKNIDNKNQLKIHPVERSFIIQLLMLNSKLKLKEISAGLKVPVNEIKQCLEIDPKTKDFKSKNPYIRSGIMNYIKERIKNIKDLWN